MTDILEMENVSKSFGTVKANDNINLSVREGEIHAVIGENGAGKTTLMRILYGLERRDSGKIRFRGQPINWSTPQMAMKHGIGMVHQHFMLVPSLSIVDNVILGVEPTRRGLIDRKTARNRVTEIADRYNLAVNPDALVQDCSVGIQQRVEIVKALSHGADLLVLDEPTAVLTPQETVELFSILRSMRDDGKTIIFISHKLREVLEISERITVMRQGRVVDHLLAADATEQILASAMVGRDVLLRVEKQVAQPKEPVLTLEYIRVRDTRGLMAVKQVSMNVRSGEILGIAGVEGNGQTELVEAVCGLRPCAGRMMRDGVNLANKPIREIRDAGIAHIPEDRFLRGLCGEASILENLIGGFHRSSQIRGRWGFSEKKARAFAERLVEEYGIKIGDLDDPAKSLSGGNAQKVVVARELMFNTPCLIASQPTRGVDIGAIEFIHQTLIRRRDEGTGILLISADLQEILSLSDRILVMYEGQVVGEFIPSETTEEELGLYMTGSKRQGA